MSDEMPKEIYVWVQSPPNREPYFVADACPFPAAPECTRYIRADLAEDAHDIALAEAALEEHDAAQVVAAEAKALADRLESAIGKDITQYGMRWQLASDVLAFLRKQSQ